MSNLKIFESNEFGKIRVEVIDSIPWFCLKDGCDILDIKNHRDVITRLNSKGVVTIDTLTKGGVQKMTYINESNLYKLIFQSRKAEAERFTDWITDEVLPSIRKNGIYAKDELLDNPELLLEVVMKLKKEKEEKLQLQEKNQVLELEKENNKPKVLFAESVAASKTSILIGELAKILKQRGYNIGQNKLFAKLRDLHYLGNNGNYRNIPTQKSMEMGLFEIKKSTIINPDGSIRETTTTKVTGKGQIYFISKFLGEVA